MDTIIHRIRLGSQQHQIFGRQCHAADVGRRCGSIDRRRCRGPDVSQQRADLLRVDHSETSRTEDTKSSWRWSFKNNPDFQRELLFAKVDNTQSRVVDPFDAFHSFFRQNKRGDMEGVHYHQLEFLLLRHLQAP